MKKMIIILAVILLGAGGYFGYQALSQVSNAPDTPPKQPTVDEVNLSKPEEDIVDVTKIIDEEILIDDGTQSTDLDTLPLRRAVPDMPALASFKGPFIKFSYYETQEVIEESISSLKVVDATSEDIIAVFDIYSNPDHLSIEDFLKDGENVQNYFKEAEDNGIEAVRFSHPGARDAYKFADMPGFVTQDIYLISIGDYIVVVSAWTDKLFVAQTIVTSIELAQ